MPVSNKLPLVKIISGGQTGADRAGLYAAKELGLQTGGWMPVGFRTLDGDKPEYAELFGIIETVGSSAYPPRTAMNVKNSSGTIRFACDWESAGERLTMKMIQQYSKPYHSIKFEEYSNATQFFRIGSKFRTWIREKSIRVLNVAGNSESTAPGIYDFVFNFLVRSLKGYV